MYKFFFFIVIDAAGMALFAIANTKKGNIITCSDPLKIK